MTTSIVITGATGFIGRALCKRLEEKKARKKDNQEKKEQLLPTEVSNELQTLKAPEKETRKESISLAGATNAALGTAAVDLVKNMFTSKEDMPATKRDIQEVKALLNERYLLIKNIRKDAYGRSAYYDVLTSMMVYR